MLKHLIATWSVFALGLSPAIAARKRPSDDRAHVIRETLNDARSRWKGALPCISDHLQVFGTGRDSPALISRMPTTISPFSICAAKHPSASSGDRFVTISEPKIVANTAVLEFAYACPLCGYGMAFSLVKKNGKWRVVDRRPTWIS